MDVQTIKELLKKDDKSSRKQLLEFYRKEFNVKVCTTCPGVIETVLQKLKNMVNESKFALIKDSVIYRIEKGKAGTISNKTMTDEKAIAFLTVRPERIDLFDRTDWDKIGHLYDLTEFGYPKEDQEELLEATTPLLSEDNQEDHEESQEVEEDCLECRRETLELHKMQELREMFPNIKAVSKEEFINKVIEQENEGTNK